MGSGRTPVTVLTGFLGAGKTTLLNALLRAPELAGAAVLINEFGEVGIDHLLVERLDEETVLLASGCLCCSVRGDLVRALTRLAPRAAAGEVRRVVIETTGLADPAPVLQTLMADLALVRSYALDGVVTVVDALNADSALATQPEAVRQVAIADRLVLAKTDLAAPGTVAALSARLRRLNPAAPLIVAVRGAVEPAALLGCGPFDPAERNAAVWRVAGEPEAPSSPDASRHDARISAFCLSWDKPLPWQGVGMCLQMLIATRGESLLRVKGILDLAGQARPVAIHGVGHVFHDPELLPAWPEGEARRSRLVFITRDLDRATVTGAFAAFTEASDGTEASGGAGDETAGQRAD